jgi:hypothetical protein
MADKLIANYRTKTAKRALNVRDGAWRPSCIRAIFVTCPTIASGGGRLDKDHRRVLQVVLDALDKNRSIRAVDHAVVK